MVIITLPDGKKVEGKLSTVVNSKENWNEYELEDGIVIRLKSVVTEIYRLSDNDPSTGKPNFLVKSNNAMAVLTPEER